VKLFARIICLLIAIVFLNGCNSDAVIEATSYNIVFDSASSDIVDNAHIENQNEIIITIDEQIEITIPYELTLNDVLAIANKRRQGIKQPDISIAQELTKGSATGSINSQVWLSSVARLLLSQEEAIYDAETYFDMLRYAYGAYTYFGGDEVFLPIFDKIIEALYKQEKWTPLELANEIHSQLSTVIFDNHLSINRKFYTAEYNFFVWEAPFDKDNSRFRKRDTGLYVAEIAGYNLDDVFRLSMNEEGEFFYLSVFAEPEDKSSNFSIKVIYENGDKEIVNIRKYNPRRWPHQDSSLRYENNIPIVTLRKMFNPFTENDSYGLAGKEYIEDTVRFLSFAEQLKDEEIIIIDLRSNQGGYDVLAKMWLYSLTGESIPGNYIYLWRHIVPPDSGIDERLLELEKILQQQREGFLNSPYIGLALPFSQYSPLGENWIVSYLTDRIVSNDKLIVLLIDRYTLSAGEVFTDLLFNMENTLVIGQNTGGCLITSGSMNYYLPYSNIRFDMPPALHIFDETHFREGIGIAPDVWVVGDALKAALAMLGRR